MLCELSVTEHKCSCNSWAGWTQTSVIDPRDRCVCPGFVRTNIYQNAQAVGLTLPAGVAREQPAGARGGSASVSR